MHVVKVMFKQGNRVTSVKQHLVTAAQPAWVYLTLKAIHFRLNILTRVNLSLSFFITCGSSFDFNSSVGMKVVVGFFEYLITYFPLELKV